MSEPLAHTVIGRVVRDGQDRLWIKVPRLSACQGCGKSDSCATPQMGGGAPSRLPVVGLDVRAGDTVSLSCAGQGVLKAAFLAYGVPALGLVLGALGAALAGGGDFAELLGAALGLGLGLLTTRLAVARGHLPELILNEE